METAENTSTINSTLEKIKKPSLPKILLVQQCILKAVNEFMFKKQVLQLMPIMLSPITDPLNHSVVDAGISYAGRQWSLTKSMIFHKQLALMNPLLQAIYIISPNVRLEMADRADTGRHLFEFTQVDFEFKNKDKEFVMDFMEELIKHVFDSLNKEIPQVIKDFRGCLLTLPQKFKRYRTEELDAIYEEHSEMKKSKVEVDPFWLLNHKREFYDKEDPSKLGTYLNYDLIYPEGFGEGLSGAERENEYHQIIKRMEETGTNKETFRNYLALAESGELHKTAGAGFGVERMTRYVCALKDVDEVTIFSRKPFQELIF